jgi:carbon monoxide dehydrogenase subunit G
MVEYQTSVVIEAVPDQVWRVLTDFETYGQWNDFYRKVVTQGQVGDRIRMHVTLGRLKVVSVERIRHREENQSLAWGLDSFLLRSGVHRKLSAMEGGRTEVTSVFKAAGPIAGIAMPLFGRQIQSGMEHFLEALRTRVQSA